MSGEIQAALITGAATLLSGGAGAAIARWWGRRRGWRDAFPSSTTEAEQDLIEKLEAAMSEVTLFGLTRSHFVRPHMRELLIQLSKRVPVRIFMMDPDCTSRADRYRIEPIDAAQEDPAKFRVGVVKAYQSLLRDTHRIGEKGEHGLNVYYFNFPCSFAIEKIDDTVRVMLYGHGVRGTQSPILVWRKGSEYYEFFVAQLRWVQSLESGNAGVPWDSRGLSVVRMAT